MTKIKLCGMKRICDIEYVNELSPDYMGFVFAKKSKRYVSPEAAKELRACLNPGIIPVGVFVDEAIERITELLDRNIIEAVQLHGEEDEQYIGELRMRSSCTIIKAFRVKDLEDIKKANHSSADYILLDSGAGSGKNFDWSVLKQVTRPYFLAGGINAQNVGQAIGELSPFGVDASSSLEMNGLKDKEKMTAFVNAVRFGKDKENYG